MLLNSSNIYKVIFPFLSMIPEDTVLVIVDMQDYLNQYYDSSKIKQVINTQNTIIQDCRKLGSPVIFLRYDVSGGILDEIARQPEDVVVQKNDTDGFYKTTLLNELRKTGKSRVLFVGGQGLTCLHGTVSSGINLFKDQLIEGRSYKIFVAENAMLSKDWYSSKIALAKMNSAGAEIIKYTPYAKVGHQLEFLF
jgi:nicotinamidase-related amidase